MGAFNACHAGSFVSAGHEQGLLRTSVLRGQNASFTSDHIGERLVTFSMHPPGCPEREREREREREGGRERGREGEGREAKRYIHKYEYLHIYMYICIYMCVQILHMFVCISTFLRQESEKESQANAF